MGKKGSALHLGLNNLDYNSIDGLALARSAPKICTVLVFPLQHLSRYNCYIALQHIQKAIFRCFTNCTKPSAP